MGYDPVLFVQVVVYAVELGHLHLYLDHEVGLGGLVGGKQAGNERLGGGLWGGWLRGLCLVG